MNLLQETLDMLATCGKTASDVEWVGSSDGKYAICWDAFAQIANIEYNDGYGAQEIATDLVIVSKDGTWWLCRHEYDGSERWEFETIPRWTDTPPDTFTNVGGPGVMWSSLAVLNRGINGDDNG